MVIAQTKTLRVFLVLFLYPTPTIQLSEHPTGSALKGFPDVPVLTTCTATFLDQGHPTWSFSLYPSVSSQ